MSEMMT